MFGEELSDAPVVQVSIDSSLSPEDNWAIGKAVAKLRFAYSITFFSQCSQRDVCRREGILVISGGLTIHNLRDFAAFSPDTCKPIYREFDRAILDTITIPEVRNVRMFIAALTINWPL